MQGASENIVDRLLVASKAMTTMEDEAMRFVTMAQPALLMAVEEANVPEAIAWFDPMSSDSGRFSLKKDLFHRKQVNIVVECGGRHHDWLVWNSNGPYFKPLPMEMVRPVRTHLNGLLEFVMANCPDAANHFNKILQAVSE